MRDGVQSGLREGIGHWDGQPVVWLQLDLDSSLALYNEVKALVQSLRVALGQVDSYLFRNPSRGEIDCSLRFAILPYMANEKETIQVRSVCAPNGVK